MSKAQITADFKVNTADARKGVKQVDGEFKKLGSSLKDSLRSSMRSGLTIAGGAVAAGISAAVTKSLHDGLKQSFSMEGAEVGLKSLLGGAEKARVAMAMINAEAAENPMFSKADMAEAATALSAFADKDVGKLKEMLELSQKLSTLKPQAGIMGAAEAVRDALGGETERLKEFGFSGKELSAMKSGGGDMAKALEDALTRKGITAETLRDSANTLSAKMSEVRNEVANTGQAFWETAKPELIPAFEDLSTWLQANRTDIVAGIQTLTDVTRWGVDRISTALGAFDDFTEKAAEGISNDYWGYKTPQLAAIGSAGAFMRSIDRNEGEMGTIGAVKQAWKDAKGHYNAETGQLLGERALQLKDKVVNVNLKMSAGSSGQIPKPMVHS